MTLLRTLVPFSTRTVGAPVAGRTRIPRVRRTAAPARSESLSGWAVAGIIRPTHLDLACRRRGAGQRVPAWRDEGDEGQHVDVAGKKTLRKLRKAEGEAAITSTDYEERLREHHAKMNPTAGKWASLGRKRSRADGEEDREEEALAERLLQSAGAALQRGGRLLPPGVLETTRMRDANQHEPSQSVVQTVEFHPVHADVLLTAGFDKKLRLFQVDGARNPRLQTVFLEDMPIHQASFAGPGGESVLVTGRRQYFYLYNVNSNKAERVKAG